MMKLVTATVLGIGLIFTNSSTHSSEQPVEKVSKEYSFFPYTIIEVDADSYYAENQDDKNYPGLVFNQKNIKSGEHFKVGDTVVGVFDSKNPEDGLINVVKGDEN